MDNAAIAYAIGAFLFLIFGIRLGVFTPRGISLFLLCGAIVVVVIASGFVLFFIVVGAVIVISLMIFLAIVYGHESPPQNEAPCDPNWKPVDYRPRWIK